MKRKAKILPPSVVILSGLLAAKDLQIKILQERNLQLEETVFSWQEAYNEVIKDKPENHSLSHIGYVKDKS